MTHDNIIRMAQKAGFTLQRDERLFSNMLIRFATLAAAAEREACAKLCDEAHELMNSSFQGAAAAIRARGNT